MGDAASFRSHDGVGTRSQSLARLCAEEKNWGLLTPQIVRTFFLVHRGGPHLSSGGLVESGFFAGVGIHGRSDGHLERGKLAGSGGRSGS